MLRRSLSSGSFTPLTSSKSFGSLKRRKSDAAKPTALVSSLLTSKTGTVVELLGGSDKSWLLEIYADEDELAAQLTHHAPSSAAAIKIVVLDPLEPGHRPFDPEDALHQPGKGLAGKTVWYHLLPETSGSTSSAIHVHHYNS
ncbi:hypothetical protein JCM11251_000403 [Rhodosporidiobolus azoricus]